MNHPRRLKGSLESGEVYGKAPGELRTVKSRR